jgi:hypothetical protein
VTVGRELAAALRQIDKWISNPESEDLNIKDDKRLLVFGKKIKTALRDVWKDHATDVFDIGFVILCLLKVSISNGFAALRRTLFVSTD